MLKVVVNNCPELLLFGFTSLPSVIGLKSLRHFLDQSDSNYSRTPRGWPLNKGSSGIGLKLT